MASKNVKRGSNAIVYSVLIVGVLILVNIIASQKFKRVDLTEDQIYTISEASKKLVASLPDRLTIKAFISSDLPAQVKGIDRYLRDMLEEYQTYSKGKVVWEALDPSKDEKSKEMAQRLKVPPARLSVYEKTKASVTESYLGVAFQYGGKVETIPFVTDIADLEYQISSTIHRLTTNKKKVGFTSGHGEPTLYQGMGAAKQALKEFDVTTVDLTEGKTPIPDDVDILVMVGPKKPLAERAKYEIDQFLMKGKPVAFFLDGMTLETPRGQFMPNQPPPRIARANVIGLKEMLEYYGVKFNQDIIMDRQNQRVILPAGNGRRVITNYPAFPIITEDALSKESLITKKMKGLVMIFPSSIELSDSVKKGKAGVSGLVLAKSSEASWRQKDFFVFNPLQKPEPTKEIGPFNLAVSLQGSLKSYFAGKPVPTPGPAKPEAEVAAAKPEAASGKGPKSPPSTRIVVVGDAELIQDQFLGLYPGNLHLLQNTIDFLAQDETLIAIRAKSQTRRPLKNVEDSKVTQAKVANIVLLPLAFVIFGVVRWRVRKASRKHRAEKLVNSSL